MPNIKGYFRPVAFIDGTDATRVSNTLEDRNNAAAEVVKVVSSSMLGLTVGCPVP